GLRQDQKRAHRFSLRPSESGKAFSPFGVGSLGRRVVFFVSAAQLVQGPLHEFVLGTDVAQSAEEERWKESLECIIREQGKRPEVLFQGRWQDVSPPEMAQVRTHIQALFALAPRYWLRW